MQVRDGEVFQGSGWTVEALHTPGHTSNHVCYALLEENTLFAGDHVMAWSTSVAECSLILFKILLAAFLRAAVLALLATVNE